MDVAKMGEERDNAAAMVRPGKFKACGDPKVMPVGTVMTQLIEASRVAVLASNIKLAVGVPEFTPASIKFRIRVRVRVRVRVRIGRRHAGIYTCNYECGTPTTTGRHNSARNIQKEGR